MNRKVVVLLKAIAYIVCTVITTIAIAGAIDTFTGFPLFSLPALPGILIILAFCIPISVAWGKIFGVSRSIREWRRNENN